MNAYLTAAENSIIIIKQKPDRFSEMERGPISVLPLSRRP